MSDKLSSLFDDNVCLTTEEIQAYAEGRLKGADLHRAERHLLDCAFCAEALEGIVSEGNTERIPGIVAELNNRIDRYHTTGQSGGNSFFSFQRIAAAITLLVVTGGLWFYFSNRHDSEHLYSQYYEPFSKSKDSNVEIKEAEHDTMSHSQTFAWTADTAAAGKVVTSQSKMLSAKAQESNEGAVTLSAEKSRSETTESNNFSVTLSDSLTANGYTFAQKDVSSASDEKKSGTFKNGNTVAEEPATKQSAPAALYDEVIVAPSAAKREKEYADIRVDASQLQRAPLQSAILHYQAKEYALAFEETEKFLKKFPKDAEALFYSGVSALSIQKEKVAAQRLKSCLDTGSQQWKEDASWYLALCYLKLNKPNDAKPLLQFLAGSNSEHASEAKNMLGQIH